MILVESIIGSRLDPLISGRLHDLEHHGLVDTLALPSAELDRRRFRAKSTSGESVAIAIPRDQKLFDGAVLLLEDNRALVVRINTRHWLRLQPRSIADAVQLGYNAGNLHWRVKFNGEALLVALEGPADEYLERLAPLIASHGVTSSVMTED